MTTVLRAEPLAPYVPEPYRWDCERFWELGETGVFRGQKVMLIDGVIVAMSPQNVDHSTAILLLLEILTPVFRTGYVLRPQMPLALDQSTDPEPDVAVVIGNSRSYRHHHPQTAALVVEVSETSVRYDLGEKANLYAGAGIADYWVIDLTTRQVIVHRDPVVDATQPHGGRYQTCTTHDANATIAPLAMPSATIRVVDLLP